MNKRKGPKFEFQGTKGAIIFLLLICMVVGYYFYLSNHTGKENSQGKKEEITAVQNVLLRNLEVDYPPTPKEVIKYYSELTQCLYNEKLTEDDIQKLADRARELYDEELNENNEEGQYILNLKEDIEDFNKLNIRISSYVIPASTEVEEFQENGRECARIYCTYNIRQGSTPTYSREVFILRRAENGRWKILGWNLMQDEKSQ